MSSKADPFEAFREKKKLEALERHVRSSPAVKCPEGAANDSATRAAIRKTSGVRPAFDPERSWIY